MRAAVAVSVIAALIAAIALPGPLARAKGSERWVLTGGELGTHAMAGVQADLVDDSGFQIVAAPAALPTPRYDLYNDYNNFAIPYEMWQQGGAWVHYYPTADLLEFQGDDSRGAPHTWYRPSSAISATLRHAVDVALAQDAAGSLPATAIAAGLQDSGLDKAEYRISPYTSAGSTPTDAARAFYAGDHGTFQISGDASGVFVMQAVLNTVSRPPAGASAAAPAFEIRYAADFGGGVATTAIGLFGYYTPPSAGHSGRFWEDASGQHDGTYFATTTQFDAIIARAIAPDPDTGRVAPSATVTVGRSSGAALATALVTALALVAALGGVSVVAQRRNRQS